jgi:hypothetical protein
MLAGSCSVLAVGNAFGPRPKSPLFIRLWNQFRAAPAPNAAFPVDPDAGRTRRRESDNVVMAVRWGRAVCNELTGVVKLPAATRI